MKYVWLILGSAVAATPAMAQDITLKPLADARVRHETVDQAGLPDDADALTIRVRSGIQASSGPLTATVEAQGTLAVVGDYYDGLHGAATRPLVADPQNIALYLAELQYRTKAIAVTVGRQRIALDDEGFFGGVPFRDNGQTFDAARV
jgi:hypothetical protein